MPRVSKVSKLLLFCIIDAASTRPVDFEESLVLRGVESAKTPAPTTPSKVKVTVFEEGLCPACIGECPSFKALSNPCIPMPDDLAVVFHVRGRVVLWRIWSWNWYVVVRSVLLRVRFIGDSRRHRRLGCVSVRR
jgi:hypothetical protein